MQKNTLIGCIAGMSLFIMPFAHAATICDVKTQLTEARTKLVDMLGMTDKAQQTEAKKAVDQASTALETTLETLLKEGTLDKAKLTQFQETWAAFKKTREEEIIPAFQAGKMEVAKKLASTVQAERVKTMNEVIAGLDGDKCKTDKK